MSSTDRKRQLVAFDAQLRELARLAPDRTTQRDINRALHYYRKRHCTPFAEKKAEILQRLADGATTFSDLRVETGYTKKSLSRALNELLADGTIRSEKIRRTNCAGRPQISYFLVEPYYSCNC